MNRAEFCKHHWEYYIALENDFIATERYISFDLGDNYSYNIPDEAITVANVENSLSYSIEYIKQYQGICSEVDVLLKSICKDLDNPAADNMELYTSTILGKWSTITNQKIKFKDIELQPLANWKTDPEYKSPDWWKPYNKVKHKRIDHYKEANLKNVLNALAGLYILENYFVKFIGDRDNDLDVPNDISHIFEMVNFNTREEVIGKNYYLTTDKDVDALFD